MKEREDGPATGLQQLARERKLPRAAPSEANKPEREEENKVEKEKELKEGSGGSQRRRECGGPSGSQRQSFDVGQPSHSPDGE